MSTQTPNTGLVFVYGTLKKGFRLHHLLARSTYIGEAITRKAAFHLSTPNEAWPAILPNGKYHIKGEIYRVDKPTLDILDAAEGVPRLFVRAGVKLRHYKGLVSCYVASDSLQSHMDKDAKFDCIHTDDNARTQEWVGDAKT